MPAVSNGSLDWPVAAALGRRRRLRRQHRRPLARGRQRPRHSTICALNASSLVNAFTRHRDLPQAGRRRGLGRVDGRAGAGPRPQQPDLQGQLHDRGLDGRPAGLRGQWGECGRRQDAHLVGPAEAGPGPGRKPENLLLSGGCAQGLQLPQPERHREGVFHQYLRHGSRTRPMPRAGLRRQGACQQRRQPGQLPARPAQLRVDSSPRHPPASA